jgi:hypothetical protein
VAHPVFLDFLEVHQDQRLNVVLLLVLLLLDGLMI